MSKLVSFILTAIMLFVSIPLFADDDFITYTEIFTHLGADGGDPEYVFAEFIEDWSLYSVSQKFKAGEKEFFEPIIYFLNCNYQFACDKIYNNKEYKIKLFKNRFGRKKTKPKQNTPNINKQTIIVDLNGTGDYTTIQEGIDNASDGDIILVYPGTYYENIDYDGKNITVASKYYTTGDEAYINNTIIDGDNNGSCVLVNMDENNGYVVYCMSGNFYITNCTIYGNYKGVRCTSANTKEIVNSILWGNVNADIIGSPTITYSCIEEGYTGTGNIDDDPLFDDASNGDFKLRWDKEVFSPCIDTGDPDEEYEDADGSPADMGAIPANTHDYFRDDYDGYSYDNIDWISFPVLNRTTEEWTDAIHVLEQ